MVGPVELSEETNYPEFEIKKLHRECMQLKSTSQSICWLTKVNVKQTKSTVAIKIDRNILYYKLMEIWH